MNTPDLRLMIAICDHDDEAILLLLEEVARGVIDVNTSLETGHFALFLAAQWETPWLVERLLDLGADLEQVNHGGATASISRPRPEGRRWSRC